MKLVQATALLAAIVLTVTVPSVSQAGRVSAKCRALRDFAQHYTDQQLEQIADSYALSARDRAWAKRCLGRK